MSGSKECIAQIGFGPWGGTVEGAAPPLTACVGEGKRLYGVQTFNGVAKNWARRYIGNLEYRGILTLTLARRRTGKTDVLISKLTFCQREDSPHR